MGTFSTNVIFDEMSRRPLTLRLAIQDLKWQGTISNRQFISTYGTFFFSRFSVTPKLIYIQVNLIITLSLGSIETNLVTSETVL